MIPGATANSEASRTSGVPSSSNAASSATRLVKRGKRPIGIAEFESSVVDYFIEAADLLGVPKSVAAIYGICFASPEPLGFSEITERLDISSGSISQGLKFLREVGALKLSDSSLSAPGNGPKGLANGQWQRAQRAKERYEPDMHLRKLALHFIEERLEKQLAAESGRLDAINASMSVAGDTIGPIGERLKALQTWHTQARALIPVIKTFLKLT